MRFMSALRVIGRDTRARIWDVRFTSQSRHCSTKKSFRRGFERRKNTGFILTTLWGIAGAFVATYLGQALGLVSSRSDYRAYWRDPGRILILLVWGFIASRRQTP